MRISSISLLNFKRFTDLVIRDIPETAKLVVVVGPNGCGKSSLFDALMHWYRTTVGFGYGGDNSYYQKNPEQAFQWQQTVKTTIHGNTQPKKGCLYVRTAYRNDADFSVNSFGKPDNPAQGIRIEKAIQNDQAVSDNYMRLIYETMAGIYNSSNDAKTVLELRDELIGQIRTSMQRVFGDLILNNLSDPLGAGSFFFEKGAAKSYHFKNLSGGEKAAFDLLLDVHVKKKFYEDAIYCIDELETHLHTRVQGALLKEIVAVLPEQAQLWVTTHSLGVIRAAQGMAAADPGSVSLIDFDGVDPDVPREIVPSSLGRVSWEKMLSIALDDLSERIAPTVLIVCEGSTIGNRRKNFDAEIYNRILGTHNQDILFISGGSSNQVEASGVSIQEAMRHIVPSAKVWSLIDRDDMSDADVIAIEQRGGNLILPQRNLESFIFANDVLEALVNRERKPELLQAALDIREQALANCVSRGKPGDDLKSAAGEIYVGLKRLLALQRCGNSADSFMKDTLCPLVVAEMPTYHSLKAAIIDRVL